ncbi:MAG: hypothetical protein IK126_04000 [Bacteroidales bacterium]|nr:hypothetical protein [Bacteroidales bacterium]
MRHTGPRFFCNHAVTGRTAEELYPPRIRENEMVVLYIVIGAIAAFYFIIEPIRRFKELNAENVNKVKERLYADLLLIAIADGKVSVEEKDFLFSIEKKIGFVKSGFFFQGEYFPSPLDNLAYLLIISNHDVTFIRKIIDAWEYIPYPKSKKKRYGHLQMVISMMLADGVCTPEEINYCYQIADKMGLGKIAVYACMYYFKEGAEKSADLKLMGAVLSYFENGGYCPNI